MPNPYQKTLHYYTRHVIKAFVVLVLAAASLTLDGPPQSQPLEVLELFTGRARLTRLAKSLNIPSEAHDTVYDKAWVAGEVPTSAFDINTYGIRHAVS